MIGDAILACEIPPKLWINASCTQIYKNAGKRTMTEFENNQGYDFLSEAIREWERTFFGFPLPATRQVALRGSVVLGIGGGILSSILKLARLGFESKHEEKSPRFNWIHIEDYFRIINFILTNTQIDGIINCTTPNPASNNHLLHSVRKRMQYDFNIHVSPTILKLVVRLFGIEPSVLLSDSVIVPKRLLDADFTFFFPDIDLALADLLRQSNSNKNHS